jgi:hypothetical protein
MTQKNQNRQLQHTLHARDVETLRHNVFKVFLCEHTQLDNLANLVTILLNNDYHVSHSNESIRKQNCKTFYKKHFLRNESVCIELKLLFKIFLN